MIGYPILRIIICSNLFTAIARSNLERRSALAIHPLSSYRKGVSLNSHGLLTVFNLGAAILTSYDYSIGMWVIRTAESVLLICCPPAPLAR